MYKDYDFLCCSHLAILFSNDIIHIYYLNWLIKPLKLQDTELEKAFQVTLRWKSRSQARNIKVQKEDIYLSYFCPREVVAIVNKGINVSY